MATKRIQILDQSGNTDTITLDELTSVAGVPGASQNFAAGYSAGSLLLNRTNGQIYRCTGDGTWSGLTSAGGEVLPSEFTPAQTLLVAVADQTPLPQVVADSQFVGRPAGGDLGVITAAQARAIINASSEAEFDALADAGIIDGDRIKDDAFTTASFVAGAGGKFAADCIDNTAARNIFAADAFGADADCRGAFITDFIDSATADDIIADRAVKELHIAANTTSGTLHQVKRYALFPVNFATIAAQAPVLTGPTFPDNAFVTRFGYFVSQTFTSASDAATIGIGFNTDDADGCVAATAISAGGNIWDAGGHDGIQSGAWSAVGEQLTAARQLEFTRGGGEDLTAGSMLVYVEYVVGL